LPNYTVRLAYESDIAHLAEVERLAAQRFLPYLDQLQIPAELLEGLISRRFLRWAQVENRLWVAIPQQRETQPVGFIVVKFLPKSCFVVELSVHPDFGRQGIGSALVEACGEGAKSRGADQLTLTTFRHVPWNIPFYQKVGFKILPSAQWSEELQAIVDHETRYGFSPQHRVVMVRNLERGQTLERASQTTASGDGWHGQ